jgi:hypothetical protein
VKVRFDDQPHDHLTELVNIGLQAILEATEGEELWIAVMINDGSNGGIVLHGYEEGIDAFEDVVKHLNAIAASAGMKLTLIPMPKPLKGGRLS